MKEYKESCVHSATKEKLVVLVYESLLSSLKKARIYLSEKKSFNGISYIEAAHRELERARACLSELLLSLNEVQGKEIARNLKTIYLYLLDVVTEANLKKDIKKIELAANAIVPLLEAFKEAVRKTENSAPERQIEVLG